MAFGIGTMQQESSGGIVKGIQKEIACECWFTSTGRAIPLMLKLQDENGEICTIREIRVHSQEKKNYAGTPSIEYDCSIVFGELESRVKLVYFQTESRWVLLFRQ